MVRAVDGAQVLGCAGAGMGVASYRPALKRVSGRKVSHGA